MNVVIEEPPRPVARRARWRRGAAPARAGALVAALSLAVLPARTVGAGSPVRAGTPPPAVRWVSVEGDTLSWANLGDGRPVVAVFWATWCRVCRRHWPRLARLAERYAGRPGAPRWAAISVGEPPDRVARVARERGIPGWILVDPDERGARALGVETVPTACVLDASGRVAYFGQASAPRLRRVIDGLVDASGGDDAGGVHREGESR